MQVHRQSFSVVNFQVFRLNVEITPWTKNVNWTFRGPPGKQLGITCKSLYLSQIKNNTNQINFVLKLVFAVIFGKLQEFRNYNEIWIGKQFFHRIKPFIRNAPFLLKGALGTNGLIDYSFYQKLFLLILSHSFLLLDQKLNKMSMHSGDPKSGMFNLSTDTWLFLIALLNKSFSFEWYFFNISLIFHGERYSRMSQVKFVEDSL